MKKLKLLIDDYIDLMSHSCLFVKKHWLASLWYVALAYTLCVGVDNLVLIADWIGETLHDASVSIGRVRNRIIHAFKKRKK